MKHLRQKIRERIAADLAALAGGRVYSSRVYPKAVLPAIAIYTTERRAENEVESVNAPWTYTRRIETTIEVTAEAVANVDNAVDDLCAQVEALLAVDPTLNGLAVKCVYAGTQHAYSADEKPLMTARMRYDTWARTSATDPENAL